MSYSYYSFQSGQLTAEQYDFMLTKAQRECDKIDVFTRLFDRDHQRRTIIADQIKNPASHFDGIEPQYVSVTQKPFLAFESELFLVHRYVFTSSLKEQLMTQLYRAEIGNEIIFTLFNQDQPFLFFSLLESYFLLGKGEVQAAESLGFTLEKYNLLYNNTIDGVPGFPKKKLP